MKKIPLRKYQTSTKVIWVVLLVIAAAILCLVANPVIAFPITSVTAIGLLMVFTIIVYRVHVNSIEQKTKQLTA